MGKGDAADTDGKTAKVLFIMLQANALPLESVPPCALPLYTMTRLQSHCYTPDASPHIAKYG